MVLPLPAILSVLLGYLLGSIPSAVIIGKLFGDTDMRTEHDGRISAAAVHRRLGKIPYLFVVIMDISLSALAVIIARSLTQENQGIMMTAGFAAVLGHNWSIFLKFRGGLGATSIGGVLLVVATIQVLIAAVLAMIALLILKKTGLSTGIALFTTSVVILITNGNQWLVAFPLILFMLMLLKRAQIARSFKLQV